MHPEVVIPRRGAEHQRYPVRFTISIDDFQVADGYTDVRLVVALFPQFRMLAPMRQRKVPAMVNHAEEVQRFRLCVQRNRLRVSLARALRFAPVCGVRHQEGDGAAELRLRVGVNGDPVQVVCGHRVVHFQVLLTVLRDANPREPVLAYLRIAVHHFERYPAAEQVRRQPLRLREHVRTRRTHSPQFRAVWV